MHERSEIALRLALRQWRARQRSDGLLTAILVFISSVVTLRFVFSHSSASAFVMGLFLIALVVSCLRLLHSAARIVEIRKTLYPGFGQEIIDVEVLTPAEHRAETAASSSSRDRHLLN